MSFQTVLGLDVHSHQWLANLSTPAHRCLGERHGGEEQLGTSYVDWAVLIDT